MRLVVAVVPPEAAQARRARGACLAQRPDELVVEQPPFAPRLLAGMTRLVSSSWPAKISVSASARKPVLVRSRSPK